MFTLRGDIIRERARVHAFIYKSYANHIDTAV
jgi:hypothetical protein